MYSKLISFCLFSLTILLFSSCEHEPLPPIPVPPLPIDTTGTGGNDTTNQEVTCDPNTIYFEQMIRPLLNSNCAVTGCHDPITAEDDVVLSDYQNIISTGEVQAFNPFESEIIEVLFETDPDDKMPPPGNTPLTTEQRNLLIDWINQGAQNNSCEASVCDTVNVTFSQSVMPIIAENCTGCHSGNNPSGNISLTNYAQISNESTNGKLLDAMKGNPNAVAMPLNSPLLSDCRISIIEIWINNGTPNN